MHTGFSKQTTLRYKLSGFDGNSIDSTQNRSWARCTACGLCRTRTRVALKRRGGSGRIRLLLIGEAPGEFEDVLGVPFVGPAGNILDKIIGYVTVPFSYLITNTVSCRPQTIVYLSTETEDHPLEELQEGSDYEIVDHNREPTSPEIEACRPHIDELFNDYQPHGIVYLGKVAKAYKAPTNPLTRRKTPTLELIHPAAITRLEFKLQKVKLEAQKLTQFLTKLKDVVDP